MTGIRAYVGVCACTALWLHTHKTPCGVNWKGRRACLCVCVCVCVCVCTRMVLLITHTQNALRCKMKRTACVLACVCVFVSLWCYWRHTHGMHLCCTLKRTACVVVCVRLCVCLCARPYGAMTAHTRNAPVLHTATDDVWAHAHIRNALVLHTETDCVRMFVRAPIRRYNHPHAECTGVAR